MLHATGIRIIAYDVAARDTGRLRGARLGPRIIDRGERCAVVQEAVSHIDGVLIIPHDVAAGDAIGIRAVSPARIIDRGKRRRRDVVEEAVFHSAGT